jgi:hypothetical protein
MPPARSSTVLNPNMRFTPDLGCQPESLTPRVISSIKRQHTSLPIVKQRFAKTLTADVDWLNMSAKEEALKRRFMAQVRRGEKLVGQDALKAAELGLGQLMRSVNGEFALSTARYGIRTPSSAYKQQDLKPW